MEQSKRKIAIELTFDWDGYDNVADEILIEDSGIGESVKGGITYKIIPKCGDLCDKAVDLLDEARLQLEYLSNKFGETGSGNNVLSRIKNLFRCKINAHTNTTWLKSVIHLSPKTD